MNVLRGALLLLGLLLVGMPALAQSDEECLSAEYAGACDPETDSDWNTPGGHQVTKAECDRDYPNTSYNKCLEKCSCYERVDSASCSLLNGTAKTSCNAEKTRAKNSCDTQCEVDWS